MSELLDAVAGLPNACEPLPGLVTGGQPQPHHLTALRRAGCRVMIDARDPMEPRPIRVPDDVTAAGLEYVNIPIGHSRGDDAILTRLRMTLGDFLDRNQAVLLCCSSGNRTAAGLIPFLMLDRDIKEEEAVALAMKCGMRSAELMEWALEYAQQRKGKDA